MEIQKRKNIQHASKVNYVKIFLVKFVFSLNEFLRFAENVKIKKFVTSIFIYDNHKNISDKGKN